MENNSYLLMKDENVKPLIIIFGGLAGKIYWRVFEFKNFLTKNIDCHLLFLKDYKRSWYQYGVEELNSNTVDDFVISIQEIIQDINYSKIITLGTSMGGFASLLFGSLLKANSIIAFSPQTFIDRTNRKKYKDFRWFQYIKPLNDTHPDKKYFDLIDSDFSNSVVDIIYGIDEILDKIHAERMNHKNINLISFEGKHDVIKNLRDNGILLEIILKHIEH